MDPTWTRPDLKTATYLPEPYLGCDRSKLTLLGTKKSELRINVVKQLDIC